MIQITAFEYYSSINQNNSKIYEYSAQQLLSCRNIYLDDENTCKRGNIMFALMYGYRNGVVEEKYWKLNERVNNI